MIRIHAPTRGNLSRSAAADKHCEDSGGAPGRPLWRGEVEMSKFAWFATVVAAAGALSVGTAGPALADTGNFGQKVYMCASMMLPYDLNSDGSITMTMPDGTSMYFRTFGAMVTYMRSHQMCS